MSELSRTPERFCLFGHQKFELLRSISPVCSFSGSWGSLLGWNSASERSDRSPCPSRLRSAPPCVRLPKTSPLGSTNNGQTPKGLGSKSPRRSERNSGRRLCFLPPAGRIGVRLYRAARRRAPQDGHVGAGVLLPKATPGGKPANVMSAVSCKEDSRGH